MVNEEYLTRKEVADYLSVSLHTVDKLIKNKDFKGTIRIGRSVRIIKSKLISYLNQYSF